VRGHRFFTDLTRYVQFGIRKFRQPAKFTCCVVMLALSMLSNVKCFNRSNGTNRNIACAYTKHVRSVRDACKRIIVTFFFLDISWRKGKRSISDKRQSHRRKEKKALCRTKSRSEPRLIETSAKKSYVPILFSMVHGVYRRTRSQRYAGAHAISAFSHARTSRSRDDCILFKRNN